MSDLPNSSSQTEKNHHKSMSPQSLELLARQNSLVAGCPFWSILLGLFDDIAIFIWICWCFMEANLSFRCILTQKELSEHFKIPNWLYELKSMLWRWENGKEQIRVDKGTDVLQRYSVQSKLGFESHYKVNTDYSMASICSSSYFLTFY